MRCVRIFLGLFRLLCAFSSAHRFLLCRGEAAAADTCGLHLGKLLQRIHAHTRKNKHSKDLSGMVLPPTHTHAHTHSRAKPIKSRPHALSHTICESMYRSINLQPENERGSRSNRKFRKQSARTRVWCGAALWRERQSARKRCGFCRLEGFPFRLAPSRIFFFFSTIRTLYTDTKECMWDDNIGCFVSLLPACLAVPSLLAPF
jgi:hypothetical protein